MAPLFHKILYILSQKVIIPQNENIVENLMLKTGSQDDAVQLGPEEDQRLLEEGPAGEDARHHHQRGPRSWTESLVLA